MTFQKVRRIACSILLASGPAFGQGTESAVEPLRQTLKTWLDNRTSAAHYEEHFVPHRNALLRAKSEKSDIVPEAGTNPPLYSLRSPLAALDVPMRRFSDANIGAIPTKDIESLLSIAAVFRKQGDSLQPLLPYLLLLEKCAEPDARIQLCLFEAWGTDALDWNEAKAAATRLAAILGNRPNEPSPKSKASRPDRLAALVFEMTSFGKDDAAATLLRLIDTVCEEHVPKNKPLERRALGKAYMPELEGQYEEEMRQLDNDFVAVRAMLAAMLALVPEDRAPALFLAMINATGSGRRSPNDESGGTFLKWFHSLDPKRRDETNARLRRLGLDSVAEGRDVARIVAAMEARKGVAFFDSQALDRVEQKKGEISSAKTSERQNTESAASLRRQAAELRRRADKIRSENNGNYESVWQGYLDQAQTNENAAAQRDADAREAAAHAQRAEGELPALEAELKALRERRRSFKLG